MRRTDYTNPTEAQASEPFYSEPYRSESPQPWEYHPHAVAARGFGQTWGILPSMAVLTTTTDWMLFGGETVTLGAMLPLSVATACVLGVIVYRAQKKWYGDDSESALIKALILALLVAIPTAIPSFIYGPAGIVGFIHQLRRK